MNKGISRHPSEIPSDAQPTALVISLSDLSRDSRVRRQIGALLRRFRVTTLSLRAATDLPVEAHLVSYEPMSVFRKAQRHLIQNLLRGEYRAWYWSGLSRIDSLDHLSRGHFSVVVANDVEALPLALEIADSPGRVLLDAHEFAPRRAAHSIAWNIISRPAIEWICRDLTQDLGGTVTVAHGISRRYARDYGFQPTVMLNAPPFVDLPVTQTDPNSVRLLHHGGAYPSRGIELMIRAMDMVDRRFDLTLVLVPSGDMGYYRKLQYMVQRRPNVQILQPVASDMLVRFGNQFDVGVYSLPPRNYNQWRALPNKLFEFIQSRLALVVGPSPEMARIVRDASAGVVAESFSPRHLAHAINGLDADQIDYHKSMSALAARELCYETQSGHLLEIVDRIVSRYE